MAVNDDVPEIAAWIHQQLDAELHLARDAAFDPPGADDAAYRPDWHLHPWGTGETGIIVEPDSPHFAFVVMPSDRDEQPTPHARHIARHDPARVLRGIRVRRDILDAAETLFHSHDLTASRHGAGIIRLLALEHEDQPGYCAHWGI